jgi:hypothetical protein
MTIVEMLLFKLQALNLGNRPQSIRVEIPVGASQLFKN